jgi:hypothetical protein
MARMVGGATKDRKVRSLVLTLVVLVLLLIIIRMSAFSGASFSAQSTNPGNTFTAGDLVIANDRAGLYVVDAADLRPGQSQQGDLQLTGDDDYAAGLSLAAAGVVVSPDGSTIADVLQLQIDDVTGAPQTLYSGALIGLGTLALTPLAPAAQRVLRFTVTFPLAAADPSLQGNSAALTVRITGVSQ